MSVTIGDVARHAGVDERTVSRVINNQPHVRDVVRARVEAAIAELGYTPNSNAQRLRFQRTFTIALAVGDSGPDFFAKSLLHTAKVAATRGYTVVLVQYDPRDPASLAAVAQLARRKQADGLIMIGPADLLETQLAPLLPAGFPWVHFGGPAASPFPTVRTDGRDGMYAMTEHLLGLGHRRIGFVSGARPRFQTRLAGFEAALTDHGIAVDPRYVIVLDALSFAGGVSSGRKLLALDPPPTAICAANDAAAAGVLAAAHEAGIRVPEQLSVTGFDDFPPALLTLPALTTVRLPLDEVSRVATEMLIELINGHAPEELHVSVPVRELVIRDSTGPPPQSS